MRVYRSCRPGSPCRAGRAALSAALQTSSRARAAPAAMSPLRRQAAGRRQRAGRQVGRRRHLPDRAARPRWRAHRPCSTSATRCSAEVVGFGEAACSCCPTRSRAASATARGWRSTAASSALRPEPRLARPRRRRRWRRPLDGGPALPAGAASPTRSRRAAPRAERRRGLGARGSLSACARSTCSRPAATASAWASSPAPASASRRCCR